MRPDHRIIFFFRMLMGCCAVSGLVLISGNGRSAIAQATATSQVTVVTPFDFNTVTVFVAPAYPSNAFSVSSAPSLLYETYRDPKTGTASLMKIGVDPKSKLVIDVNTGVYPFVYVSVTFTTVNASKTYYIPKEVSPIDGKYTVDQTMLGDLVTRFANDLNLALPPAFDPGHGVPFSLTIQIGVTPIASIVPGPPVVVSAGKVVNIPIQITANRILGQDELRPDAKANAAAKAKADAEAAKAKADAEAAAKAKADAEAAAKAKADAEAAAKAKP
jgi:hypothetical protein